LEEIDFMMPLSMAELSLLTKALLMNSLRVRMAQGVFGELGRQQ
jgi:hypothetical protein